MCSISWGEVRIQIERLTFPEEEFPQEKPGGRFTNLSVTKKDSNQFYEDYRDASALLTAPLWKALTAMQK